MSYKLLEIDQFAEIEKQLSATPCIVIVGCEDGRPRFFANAPSGRPEILIEMVISAMTNIPELADCIKSAAIAFEVRKGSN